MRLAVYGLGRLGLPLYNVLLRAGFDVVGIDPKLDEDYAVPKGMYWNTIEPGMAWPSEALERGGLSHSSMPADMSFIVVPTPSFNRADERGGFDPSHVISVLQAISGVNDHGHTVVIVSTLSPGTTEELAERFHHLRLVYNPTFVAIGTIVHDLTRPDLLLLAGEEAAHDVAYKIWGRVFGETYRPFIHFGSYTEIELIKLSINCFLGTKISLANSLGQLFTAYGVDPAAVNVIGRDHRVGVQYFMPGSPIAGPCLPRDNQALQAAAAKKNIELPISVATDRINHELIERHFAEIWGPTERDRPQTVGILGMTYKYGVDVMDESAGKRLSNRCEGSGIKVIEYDDMLANDTLSRVLDCEVVIVTQKEYEPLVSHYEGKVLRIWP